MTGGLQARRAAEDLIAGVLLKRQPFDGLFQRACDKGDLAAAPARDRALARLIATTALRRKGQIEDALERFIDRPLPAKSGRARWILLAACAQLMFLQTPPHAAIDLGVSSAGGDRATTRFKGLINAVLRRVSENADTIVAGQDAARLNTPDWLWRRWTEAFGEHRVRAIAGAHLIEPPLDLTVAGDSEAWCNRLGAHAMQTGTIRLNGAGRITEIEGYDGGAWWVQDAAAALPARLFGDISGRPVLDLCAAPGGKTAQLVAMGAEVTAVDVNAKRIARLEENLTRLRLAARCVAASASIYAPAEPPVAILLDAPCSATGTIRRHPDIAHTKDETAVANLVRIQAEMLDHAVEILAPGGTLVFCTCSLEPEEGEAHAARLVAGGRVRRLPIAPEEIGGMAECLTAEGDLRTLPCHYQQEDPAVGGLDGFFTTRLRKL